MFDLIINFLAELLCYWIGCFFLKIITFGKFDSKKNQNPFLVGLFGFICMAGLIVFMYQIF